MALCVLQRTIKVLVGLVVSAFVLYTSVFIALNSVLLSSVFQRFTSICYFPYITDALKKGAEVESFAFLKEDRLYSAAVRLHSLETISQDWCRNGVTLKTAFFLF